MAAAIFEIFAIPMKVLCTSHWKPRPPWVWDSGSIAGVNSWVWDSGSIAGVNSWVWDSGSIAGVNSWVWDSGSIAGVNSWVWDSGSIAGVNCHVLTSALSLWCGRTARVLIPCPNWPWGARWPSGRASDSRGRGQGFDTYLRRVVCLSKDTFTPRKVLVIPRK